MQNIVSEIINYGNLRAEYMQLLLETGSSTHDSVIAVDSQLTEQLNKLKFMLAGGLLTDKSVIEQLSQYFSYCQQKHTVVKQRCDDVTIWYQQGKPFEWQLIEQDGEHAVYLDTGYGHLALFENGKLVGAGKDMITTEKCVVVCRDYYSTKKYIWK